MANILKYIEGECGADLTRETALHVIRQYAAAISPSAKFLASSNWWNRFKRDHIVRDGTVAQVKVSSRLSNLISCFYVNTTA